MGSGGPVLGVAAPVARQLSELQHGVQAWPFGVGQPQIVGEVRTQDAILCDQAFALKVGGGDIVCDRTMRRMKDRHEEFGYNGLFRPAAYRKLIDIEEPQYPATAYGGCPPTRSL